jgi:choline dehydrogenase-like flavoprotein
MSAILADNRPDQAIAVVDAPGPQRKRVVIVGGGFAGLAAADALRQADAEVVVIDRRNHHIFQPLLYQVATAVLSPAEIAAPIRQLEGSSETSAPWRTVLPTIRGPLKVTTSLPVNLGLVTQPHRLFEPPARTLAPPKDDTAPSPTTWWENKSRQRM